MFNLSLQEITRIVDGDCINDSVDCVGFEIDTRRIRPGFLFVAIVGDRLNGHNFINEAISNGASAVLVSEKVPFNIPQVIVKNTQHALLALASYWREAHQVETIAVTGSCGKTTVRQLLQHIFCLSGSTLASTRSLNNHVGVPYTALQLSCDHKYYIQEIGANHMGEIKALVAIVKPNIAIITNAAEAHLSGFGSLDNVVQAKGEILLGLKSDGVAVLNKDDASYEMWRSMLPCDHLSFAVNGQADVMARNVSCNSQGMPSFNLVCSQGSLSVQLKLIGRHNISNALAAASAGLAAGLSLAVIQRGLQQAEGEQHRMQSKSGLLGATIIDDSYNANPLSVLAAIDILGSFSTERILVLGDMLEMGDMADSWHSKVGLAAKHAGVSSLYCLGEKVLFAAESFGDGAKVFRTHDDLLLSLLPRLNNKMTVLVKGSNSMHMNLIADRLSCLN